MSNKETRNVIICRKCSERLYVEKWTKKQPNLLDAEIFIHHKKMHKCKKEKKWKVIKIWVKN